ncbi:MAG: hypothetical protein C4313_03280 [Thermoflexus sp.]|uniref:HEAT repeat domain-containing protein n=1 Tax=Thermoflexus sp. TaxID=1969742 RepID=UPI003322A940
MEHLTRFCPNCWEELPPEAQGICPACGRPLDEADGFLEKLLRALWHRERTRAALAATLLGRLGQPEAVPALVEAALHHPDFGVRAAAVHSLGLLRDPRALPAFMILLREESPLPVRLAVVEAVAGWTDERARAVLRAALHDPSAVVRERARALYHGAPAEA